MPQDKEQSVVNGYSLNKGCNDPKRKNKQGSNQTCQLFVPVVLIMLQKKNRQEILPLAGLV